ncbi:MAG: hypothetical protein QJR02_11345 [Sinobacteraceae bacterium]|nr:hypothetical protein [Nevskiaceae bacterium]
MPRPPPPKMSRAEIMARSKAKRQMVLDWCATESFTSPAVVAVMLGISHRRGGKLLADMARDGLMVRDDFHGEGSPVWGITTLGLGYANAPQVIGREYEPGRITPAFARHELDVQLARVRAFAAGWTDWTPSRLLHGTGLKKVPDAIAVTPSGERVAVEIERSIKSLRRYREAIAAQLRDMRAGRYGRVIYVSPGHAAALERTLRRVGEVRIAGERLRLGDAHFARYRVLDFASFPPAESGPDAMSAAPQAASGA